MRNAPPNADYAYVRRLNQIKILNLIRDRKSISRAEIAKITGLSPPTVTRAVGELIEPRRLAVEVGEGKSQGGRPPVLIRFNGEQNLVIGVDLGTTHIYAVLSDLNGKIRSEMRIPTDVQTGAEGVLRRVENTIGRLVEDSSVDARRILGVGMAVAGLIDRDRKIVTFSPDFGWKDVDVRGALKNGCNMPIIFDNVTRVMALGELWYGVGKRFRDFVCINVGYGIGSGIIIDGKPLHGAEGFAGEFGHFPLDKDSSVRCKCGNYGCLEALASGRAIGAAAQNALATGRASILRDMCHNDLTTVDAEMVAAAAQQEDPVASEVFGRAMEYLGTGIAGLINLLNPQAVVIGGGVSQAGDSFFSSIREQVARRVMNKHGASAKILPVTLGMRSTVMGAVSLILNEVLSLNLASQRAN
ncbi:MAG: ROK family transcriptional regulator [Phycisphaerales bacterium]|nr:MAG: ROK family transcriptional regulator [Phycisphaerales bacterium]